MDFIQNLRIGARLGAAFSLLLALTLALGAAALLQLARVNDQAMELAENWLPSVSATSGLNNALADMRVVELRHVQSAKEEDKRFYENEMKSIGQRLSEQSAHYEKLLSSAEEIAGWKAYQTNFAAFMVEHEKIVALSRENRTEDALLVVSSTSRKHYEAASDQLDKQVAVNEAGGKAAAASAAAVYQSARIWVFSGLVLTLSFGALAAMAITRSLTRPLAEAVAVARTVAAGDLSSRITVRGRDETADLLQALKDMSTSLVNIVGQVRNSSDSIATGSQQIASGNADLSQRTEEQASNLQQTAASMEQMTSTVKQNADTAQTATQLAKAASTAAAHGGEVVGQVVSTMEDISTSSKKIADIIGVIDGIAFQTNILALNAAVEAARAGEQGRGFAVVASEVRSLAGRSAEAAREIKSLIGQSVEKVETGTRLVGSAGSAMEDLVGQVRRVADLIAEIGAASTEQTQGIGQVSDAITQLDQVTQQNAALVEESAAAADSLKQQAARLAEAVSVFKLAA